METSVELQSLILTPQTKYLLRLMARWERQQGGHHERLHGGIMALERRVDILTRHQIRVLHDVTSNANMSLITFSSFAYAACFKYRFRQTQRMSNISQPKMSF